MYVCTYMLSYFNTVIQKTLILDHKIVVYEKTYCNPCPV